MNRDTIYIVITTNMYIHRKLLAMFTRALKPFELEVEAARTPQIPTYASSYFNRDTLKVVISEHMSQYPLRMEPDHPQPAHRIIPPVPDTPFTDHVNIAVIGSVHSGKTSVQELLQNTLLANGIPVDNILLHSLDHGIGPRLLSLEEQADCIRKMPARKIMFLFQSPKRATDASALMERCGVRKTVPEQT
jgi:polynucleotide 5'-kinase involved in rRNA processing